MADPTFGTAAFFNTGTDAVTNQTGTYTCADHADDIVIVAVAVARTTTQTVSSVSYDALACARAQVNGVDVVVDDGADERIEIWWRAAPPTTTNAVVSVTLSDAARFCVMTVQVRDVLTASPFVDFVSTSVSAKTLSRVQSTLEKYSLAILAKRNSTVTPADSGGFQTHLGATATTQASAGNNIQLDADVLTTQVDVDLEAINTTASWEWNADSSARSASAIVVGIQGSQPSGIAPSSPHATRPYGIVALVQAGLTVGDPILNDLSIHGVGLRMPWSSIETSEGVYDWSYFDTQLDRIQTAGKFACIRINTGINSTPAWALSGVAVIASTPNMAIPWDPTWMQRRKNLMTAFGARYNSRTVTNGGPIRGVSVSFANWKTDDWSLPTTAGDLTLWSDAGYSTNRLFEAGKEFIAHCIAQFPDCPIFFMPYNGNGALDAEPTTAAGLVADWAYAQYLGRFVLMRNNLKSNGHPTYGSPAYANAVGTVWEPMRRHSTKGVACQNVWRIDGDTTKRQNDFNTTDGRSDNDIMASTISNLNSYTSWFIEIYAPDLRVAAQRSAWEGQVSTSAPLTYKAPRTRRAYHRRIRRRR